MQQNQFQENMTEQERRNARVGERVVKMGRELCSTLETETESHGNIWPGNVNLDEDGKATLGEGSRVPVSSRSADQVEFLAPETFWENESTPASDAYSIALIMYAAYNGGRLPFVDADGDESSSRAKALRARMKGQEIPPLENASSAVNAILAKALAYESADRYESPAELLRALSETDEALPSVPPEEEEIPEPEQPQAEETAEDAPTEEIPAEESAAAEEPKENTAEESALETENGGRLSMAELRPEEVAAGITADSIVMESELENMGREKPAKKNKSKKAKEPKAPVSESEQAKEETTAKPAKNSAKAAEPAAVNKGVAKPKQYTVDKSMEKPKKSAADKKKQNKSTRNTLLVAGLATVVVAAIIGVGVHALNSVSEEVLLSPTQAPIETVTPEPTAAPTPEPTPEPTADTQRITGYTTDKSWSELVNPDEDGEQAVNLLVITDAETFDAAVAAAEEAGLSNVWLGARYVEKTEESGVEESGWYWLDGTQLPTNSSYWAAGEPSEEADAGLMMSETEDGWRFFSVSETTFAEAAEDAYPNLGYLVSDSGIRPAVTPSPAPDAEKTGDDTEKTTDKDAVSGKDADNNTGNNTDSNTGNNPAGSSTATGGNTGSGSAGSGSSSSSGSGSVVVSAPVITKDPTGESVTEGGSCKFLAYAAAANNCTWYLVSPDGSETVSAGNAANRFSGLKVSGAWSNLLELKNIPLSLNNWKVYCSFSGAGGTTATGSARLEVSAKPVTSPSPTPTPTPTPTSTPTPTPSPTPTATPKVTAVKATGSWEQINTTKTLAIAAEEEVREAVEDAAEKLSPNSLENVWIGGRYMTATADSVTTDGWYWNDKTPIADAGEAENWVDENMTGDWLMLSLVDHDENPETPKVWLYRAVVKTSFNATDYANLGYVYTDTLEESSSTPKTEAVSLQESLVVPSTDGLVLIPVGESKLFSGVRDNSASMK